jgi:hypothetical protein
MSMAGNGLCIGFSASQSYVEFCHLDTPDWHHISYGLAAVLVGAALPVTPAQAFNFTLLKYD